MPPYDTLESVQSGKHGVPRDDNMARGTLHLNQTNELPYRVNRIMLIVEDHDAVRNSLREWIDTVFDGITIREARSGEEAVACARRSTPDVVLMDVNLPKMSGFEATRRIKVAAPQTQVVILTVLEGTKYQAHAEEVGASAYLPKRRMHSDLLPVLELLLKYHS